jgi:hypothetical protein
MPSTSPKQARFMAAAAHDPSFAKAAGVPLSVAREFNQADLSKRSKSFALASALRQRK